MDREKVIKEFADYVHNFKPYCIGDIEDHAMLTDALALLKEQEPVETEPIGDYFNVIHKCKCGYGSVLKTDNYCSKCGRKVVKWE